jgi:hypothetical protein
MNNYIDIDYSNSIDCNKEIEIEKKINDNLYFLEYFSNNPYLSKNYFFYKMIKIIKSLNASENELIFLNEDNENYNGNPDFNSKIDSLSKNKNNPKLDFDLDLESNLEIKEDPISNTLIINGYYIYLDDIISHGDNSIIYKAFKEETNQIYVNKNNK